MLGLALPQTYILWLEYNMTTLLQVLFGGMTVLVLAVLLYKKVAPKVETVTTKIMGFKGPRFRKRDKMLFYTKRMLRHMNTLTAPHGGAKRMKKRQIMLRLAKKIIFPKRDQPQLQVKEPSQAFLEEDVSEQNEDAKLPHDVIYLIRSIRIFGFLEKPLFLDLWKHIETQSIKAGEMLFDVGDEDDSIYTVFSGRISVYIKECDGAELVFKEAAAGDSIASFLSGLIVLTGTTSNFKTVSARAIEDSKVLRLRYKEFSDLLERHPDSMVRLCQIVMIRLQRVNFMALHEYLGLTTQLMKTAHQRKSIGQIKGSPIRASTARKISQINTHSLPHTPVHESPTESATQEDQPDNYGIFRKTSNMVLQRFASTGMGRRPSFVSELPPRPADVPEMDHHVNIAVAEYMKIFKTEHQDRIREHVLIRDYAPGEFITKQNNTQHVNNLYYIICGSVEVLQTASNKTTAEAADVMYIAYPGDIIGVFETLTSEVPFFSRRARSSVRVACLCTTTCYELLKDNPKGVLSLASGLIERLSPFLRQIDFAMDWIQVDSGRAVYRQNDPSDSMYIILSGRLRSVVTGKDGKRQMIGEYGRGDLVGLVEVLTEAPRATTMVAVRDTELAKLPVGLLNVIKIKHPVVVTRLIHLLGHRILGSMTKSEPLSPTQDVIPSRKTQSNFSTIAVLPVNDDVPLNTFTMELCYSLNSIGPALRLTSEFVKRELGPHALEKSNEYRLCSWLGQQEDRHKVLLYQCDKEFTSWTQRCIRQADCILIVALAEHDPQVGTLEKQAENIAKRTQKELVLLHREGGPGPKSTVDWLNIRSWCSSHHHMRCPKRIFARRSHIKQAEIYRKLDQVPVNIHSDFARLARFLTGTSIGLVLGGGGARGCSHVGMIKAITEAGIPIDMVGGVSIGAFMGALWAQEMDMTPFTQKARDWAYRTISVWHQIWDITYPITAWFTGHAFNQGIRTNFGDKQIEDLWLPYFTVTTDITDSCPRIHRHGSLWSYVRSSMSLAGILPPLCDPVDGHYLLDGGYVNNLPADVMYREMGAETIIAVDVGSQDETDLTVYGNTLSGWWLLYRRWNPFRIGEPVKIPNSAEIQSRLAYVSCVRQLEEVKSSDYCTYVRPPIDKYKTLQFASFNEIMEVGYNHGHTLFAGMKAVQQDPNMKLLINGDVAPPSRAPKVSKPTTFTDLAEMVCRVKKPINKANFGDMEYEDDDDYMSEEQGGYGDEADYSHDEAL